MTNPSVDQINLLAVAGMYLDHIAEYAMANLQVVLDAQKRFAESPTPASDPTTVVGFAARPAVTGAISPSVTVDLATCTADSSIGQFA